MTLALSLGNDFLFKKYQEYLKNRLTYALNQQEFFKRVDAIPGLSGAGVFYSGNESFAMLRPFKSYCHTNPVYVILREAPPIQQKAKLQIDLESTSRNSKLVGEMTGVALSCGAAILAWVVVLGAGTTIPISGGTSSPLVVLTIGAATASSLQCGNSIMRVGFEFAKPSLNDSLDSKEWYNNTTTALDIISVAGAIASGFATIRLVLAARAATRKSFDEILQGLNRADRKRLTEEIIRMNHPGVSNSALKAMVRAHYYPKRYSNIQITEGMKLQLKEAISATLSFTGSATSGVANSIAVGIYEGGLD
jgi:hypothetical protein